MTTSPELREADAVDLIERLAAGLPSDDPLRARILDDMGSAIVQPTALRRDLEAVLVDWVLAGQSYGGDGIPMSDHIFHGSAADRAKDEPCALDILIEGMPTSDRVRIQRAARAAGYRRPWGRGATT